MVLEPVLNERSWHDGLRQDQGAMALLPALDMVGATGSVLSVGSVHQHYPPTIKNTFIHFDDRDHVDHHWCQSAPPCTCRNLAETQPQPQKQKQQRKRKQQRPSKGRRQQYHKFIQATTVEMQRNPNAFDVELLQHHVPAPIRKNDRLLRKFMLRMEVAHECFQAQQVANPDDSSAIVSVNKWA